MAPRTSTSGSRCTWLETRWQSPQGPRAREAGGHGRAPAWEAPNSRRLAPFFRQPCPRLLNQNFKFTIHSFILSFPVLKESPQSRRAAGVGSPPRRLCGRQDSSLEITFPRRPRGPPKAPIGPLARAQAARAAASRFPPTLARAMRKAGPGARPRRGRLPSPPARDAGRLLQLGR